MISAFFTKILVALAAILGLCAFMLWAAPFIQYASTKVGCGISPERSEHCEAMSLEGCTNNVPQLVIQPGAHDFQRRDAEAQRSEGARLVVIDATDAMNCVPPVGTNRRASAPDALVYIMADGTGVPFRKKDLKGVKVKNGRAKTREVKVGAVFVGSKTEANEPHRNLDTTTYVATTDRSEKFGKILRGEFDRRFHEKPTTTIYISDGGKWHTIYENEFPFAVEIPDLYHAIEHLKPLMLGLGIKEGTKEWDSRHHSGRSASNPAKRLTCSTTFGKT